jgi:2-polyprenyl-6-methoxyphenol hydroxylase-like FAD-dependent oxidoreductase
MTATLFNQTYRYQPAVPQAPLTAPLRRIVVLGGGTAGWMAALLLGQALGPRGVQIEVLESPTVPIIGVGEGSTPWMRGFFDLLGIEESQWMPECHATYKCGIRFDGWSTKPGFESYFHPFASMLDNLSMTQFVHNADARTRGADVCAHPDRFFIAAYLAAQHRAPKPARHFPFDVWYGYHFDAALLGRYLHRVALERGIGYRSCHVQEVRLHEDGDIAAVRTREGDTIGADFFVDCSGFGGLLIQQALGTPFVDFSANLFNDAAVALTSAMGESIPSQTLSVAMDHGWMWRIPLTERYGNGYVYSSSFCSADAAETELRKRLGLLEDPTPARHLTMRVGRVTETWRRNCLAVGLSQGFIEPLEATALLFVQRTASLFAKLVQDEGLGDATRERFNRTINEQIEGTRDYIVTHYKTSTRQDTEYWRANASNMNLSDPLKQLLTLWLSGQGVAAAVSQHKLGLGYPVVSWYAILCGMGVFPEASALHPPDAQESRYSMDEIHDLLSRSATNYPDQRLLLAAIPPRNTDPSLQIYFW